MRRLLNIAAGTFVYLAFLAACFVTWTAGG